MKETNIKEKKYSKPTVETVPNSYNHGKKENY